ncbi:hypothetical protein RO3G_15971 [Rhizopus delemar RA 99-880]|uniref:Uncharacterized protein n=1 Tax=Rhizopus delemar (strain RA 99-880 / ATCC MYA-4621 / FGSC 9543 / NRRL 43880) TaxID=246409 RepID=I1CS30_RHIO9|nr:hypothetical protein RO3G_15971 [Rhizopus delemar RA 99-880]|eukprot:EIE91260.1 hypothetical protein RO3G_15971 [Rhizopus delemar RA 99-880]
MYVYAYADEYLESVHVLISTGVWWCFRQRCYYSNKYKAEISQQLPKATGSEYQARHATQKEKGKKGIIWQTKGRAFEIYHSDLKSAKRL